MGLPSEPGIKRKKKQNGRSHNYSVTNMLVEICRHEVRITHAVTGFRVKGQGPRPRHWYPDKFKSSPLYHVSLSPVLDTVHVLCSVGWKVNMNNRLAMNEEQLTD